MTMTNPEFQQNQAVQHNGLGRGTVLLDRGSTVVVRFDNGIQELLKEDLTPVVPLADRAASPGWDPVWPTVLRTQAEAILSVNNTWGVYSPALMDVLPHQLWVCRQVAADWPTFWLVADDVGLGKTVEAGLILTALMGRHEIRRILIMCPASLAAQWQQRMHTMFGLNFVTYTTEADRPGTNYWKINRFVIASLQTLRADHNNRHQRLMEAEKWDLVLVDEAHHLNADDQNGYTLAYRLIRDLRDNDLISSMIFFTGTPHRGKHIGFISLLNLLRPDIFVPGTALNDMFSDIPKVMIRNNKGSVTDLSGKRLFSHPKVTTHHYAYSAAEEDFYDMLTDFIVSGRAYAQNLSQGQRRAVMLVLIAMQKIASSSIAAVCSALKNRLKRISKVADKESKFAQMQNMYDDAANDTIGDEVAKVAVMCAETTVNTKLLENEAEGLKDLIHAAEQVVVESRIVALVNLLQTFPEERNVLLFTEFKVTQSLVVSALIEAFGEESVTFINGDNSLPEVAYPNGDKKRVAVDRFKAARLFNEGKVRFLVSTEAAGEGIDLQESCYTLVHVDLPWNPMRLHQRVGRLNRYGQKHQVNVHMLLNPDTVESRIWEILNEKLLRITQSLGAGMDDPEDLREIVLGLATPGLFDRLFSDAVAVPRPKLNEWFDANSASLGNQDVYHAVQSMLGNAQRFNFRDASYLLPRTDIPDLQRFFENALAFGSRKNRANDGTWSFITPDSWRRCARIRPEYKELTFKRQGSADTAVSKVLGVGHVVMDAALKASRESDCCVTAVQGGLSQPLLAFKVRDRVTSGDTKPLIFAVSIGTDGSEATVLADWELLKRLNEVTLPRHPTDMKTSAPVEPPIAPGILVAQAQGKLEGYLQVIDHRFRQPEAEPLALFWPQY